MLNTSSIWCLPLQQPSPCSYMSERRPQSRQTARCSYWVTDVSLWLSLKWCKRKRSRSYHLCFLITDSWLLLTEHLLTVLEQGHSSWVRSILCSPLHYLRIKATVLFLSNSASLVFIWLRWAEKAKVLASNRKKSVRERQILYYLQVEAVYSYRWTNLQNQFMIIRKC